MNGFGKPKYSHNSSNDSGFYKIFKMESDKDLVVRVLPPMKSLAESGKWGVFHSVHYGYQGLNKKDPSKTQARPFRCVEQKNFKTGMITQSCPECLEIRRKEEQLSERQAALSNRSDMSAEEKETVLSPLKRFLKDHNLDRKWHINVMALDGAFGVLQISHRVRKQLDSLIQRIEQEENVDALDPETGVWFNFRRTGKRLECVDTVEAVYVREDINGRKVNVLKSGKLTEQQVQDALAKCPDLNETTRAISLEQINALINSSGDPEEVDRILSMGSFRGERSASPSAPKKQPALGAMAAAHLQDDDEQALLAKLEAIRAKKAAAVTQPVQTKTAEAAVTNTVSAATADTVKQTTASVKTPVSLPEDKFLELFDS